MAVTPLPVLREPPRAGPCDACISGCCRGFNLVIQGWDAYRIGRDLKLPINDFVELRWAEKPDEDHQIVLDATVSQGERRYHRLVLLRVEEVAGDFKHRCVFLVTIGQHGRCGIYASRPAMCRSYPAQYRNGLLSTSGGKYCPPDVWNVETMDVALFRARHLFLRRQRLIYDLLVDGWNERVLNGGERRSKREYLHYLVGAYTELERREPAWFEDVPSGEPDPLPVEPMRARVAKVLTDLGWAILPGEPPDGFPILDRPVKPVKEDEPAPA